MPTAAPAATTILGPVIARAARRGVGLADKLLAGVPDREFARHPPGAHGRIDTNHPAWIYGHLSIYPKRLAGFAGLDPAPMGVPDGWEDLFGGKSVCRDDAAGTIYPAREVIVSAFARNYAALLDSLERLPDAVYAQPVPEERYREAFGTVGGAAAFMTGSHVMFHLGQMSAWRRCHGLGSAM
jgi:hypothetical protein